MKSSRLATMLLALAAGIPALLPATALAQPKPEPFPSKPITFINPLAAGGPQEVETRLYAQKIMENTGWKILVDFRTGAGGTRAAARAHLELWCRAELETLCRCPDVLLRCFFRRRSGTTSAECAGLAGLKIWLEYLLQIIRPWNGEFNTGAADSTLLSKSANVESL
jgi:hypothetical protein